MGSGSTSESGPAMNSSGGPEEGGAGAALAGNAPRVFPPSPASCGAWASVLPGLSASKHEDLLEDKRGGMLLHLDRGLGQNP